VEIWVGIIGYVFKSEARRWNEGSRVAFYSLKLSSPSHDGTI